MLRFVISSALATLVLLSPALAMGQESEEYQRVLREALREYDAQNYLEARALFMRAHEEQPNARTLRGIGMASFELREYVQSIRALEESLAHQVRPLTAEQRASVQTLVDRARTFVGRFTVTVGPPGARLYVDGAPADVGQDGSILLNLGEHELSVRCDGCRPESRAVVVRGGEDEAITVDASQTTEPLSTSTTSGGGAIDDDGVAGRDSGVSVPGIVLLATAGVLVGGAAAAGVWWAGRGSEVERCEMAGAACRNLDGLHGEQTAAGAVTIGLIAAAAIAATVGVILLVSSGGEDDEAEARVVCGPALMGMGCAGTF